VVDDLLNQHEGRVEAVLSDVAGDCGVVDDLVNDQGLGYEHPLADGTIGGELGPPSEVSQLPLRPTSSTPSAAQAGRSEGNHDGAAIRECGIGR
jgi:hypothetical protein